MNRNASAAGRIIPARAGQTASTSPSRCRSPDYPRACGANRKRFEGFGGGYGSSPRVRGKRGTKPIGTVRRRIIPARAGQTRVGRHKRPRFPDHPRACGANMSEDEILDPQNGSSPRVRGKPCGRFQCVGYLRIIPARARQTTSASRPTPTATDHPPVNRTPIVGLE